MRSRASTTPSRVVFNSSRLGEWLNQAILCVGDRPAGRHHRVQSVCPAPSCRPRHLRRTSAGWRRARARRRRRRCNSCSWGACSEVVPRHEPVHRRGRLARSSSAPSPGLAFGSACSTSSRTRTTSGVEFSDAAGLKTGDEVRVAGVKSGRVTDIKADREQWARRRRPGREQGRPPEHGHHGRHRAGDAARRQVRAARARCRSSSPTWRTSRSPTSGARSR